MVTKRSCITITNEETTKGWTFHNGTKLPNGELNKIHPGLFDPRVRPILFKQYDTTLEKITLPIPDEVENVDALQTLESNIEQEERFPYLETVARLLHYSAGITKTLTRGERKFDFRAASCTGALYHIELYVICSRLPGIKAGIYHYDPQDNQLQQLRQGDYRQAVIDATGQNYPVEDAPLIIAYTSMFWRNAYKYKSRTYRHAFWDSGTIMSQTLAMATMLNLNATVVTGFVDEEISNILGINPDEELPLALLPLGYTSYTGLKDAPDLDQTQFKTIRGDLQREYPSILAMHKASSLTNPEQVKQWRDQIVELHLPEKQNSFQLKPQSTRKFESDPLETVISRRGSTRKFNHEWLDFTRFSNLMKMGIQPFPADFYEEFGTIYNRVYLIVNAVEEIPMGAYRFYPEDNQLDMLQQGYLREEAKELGLGQDLAHDCAVMIVFIADLESLFETFGNRAYRIAQLEAAILGGKLYLAAYAQHIGATGLTFEDDKVTSFFGEEGKIVSFMICIGKKA